MGIIKCHFAKYSGVISLSITQFILATKVNGYK